LTIANTHHTSSARDSTIIRETLGKDNKEKGKNIFSSLNLSDDPENKMLTVDEFIKTGLKYQTNLKKPKFGVKGYNIQDTYTYEPLYKIPNHIKAVVKQKDRGNFMDDFLKYTK
jgi:hypothetical protein